MRKKRIKIKIKSRKAFRRHIATEKSRKTDFLIKQQDSVYNMKRQPVPYVKDKSMQQVVIPLCETPSFCRSLYALFLMSKCFLCYSLT